MVLLRHQHIKMNRNNIWFYIFALTLLEVAVKTKMNVQEKTNGVLQESLLDGVNLGFQELGTNAILTNGEEIVETIQEGILHFEPPDLQFGTRYLGSPHSERVVLYNRGNETLQLTSVSGNTPHFHSSFFENKVILPKGNTSFSVVFLGREMGAVSAHLYIHTSKGIQKYPVSGESVSSLYRLQPLVGVRLPHNASFSPLIYLHNPHDHPIQITEVYSSGGGLSLELPGGCREGPQALWHVPPHSTRPVVGVAYHAHASHTSPSPPHTAYVRIKINGTNTVLVVAVEVQDSAEPGPYAVPHVLDLGMAGSKDPPKQFRIYLGNSLSRGVRVGVVGLRAARPAGRQPASARGLSLALEAPLVPPHAMRQYVATLTVDWREMYAAGQCCGEIILRTKQHRLVIPYVSQPMLGGLVYNATRLSFLLAEKDVNNERDFVVQNGFSTGIFITDIELGDNMDLYFKILDFQPIALRPSQNVTLFRLGLEAWGHDVRFESKITIITNITSYEVPVYIYDGKFDVTVSTPNPRFEKEYINLGLVGTSSTTRATIWLANNNPVPICVQNWGVDMEGGAMQFLGCLENWEDDDNITACTCIGPGMRGAASLSAVAPAREGLVEGRAYLITSHHTLAWRVTLQAARGRLALASTLHLTHCFAGTICSQPLRITSSFPVAMSMSHITAVPKDQRLYYTWEGLKDGERQILPRQTSTVANIYYDPNRNCEDVCYTGLNLNSTLGKEWLLRMSLPLDTRLTDAALANHSYELYRNLTASSPYINYTLKLDTTEVYGHTMQARLTLSWPRLSSVRLVSFPLARVGGASLATLTLRNPSHHQPLLIQLVPAWTIDKGEDVQHLHQGFHPVNCDPDWSCVSAPQRTFTLPLPGDSKSDSHDDSDSYEAPLSLSSHRHPATRVFLLPPEAAVNVTVEFNASQAARLTSLLYLRNNLTMLEIVRLTGQGVYPSFKFGNRKPGSATPLLFELTEKHLKDCDKNRATKSITPPNLTVKRSFTARNTGEIPISVTNFFINGYECEGYGFKVMNCYPFVLLPNGTLKIDVAFTPDFTLARVKRTLIIVTSLETPVNYTLLTTVPQHLLELCGNVLDRPVWEPILRNITVCFMCLISICVPIAGFFESDRILKMAMANMTRDRTAVHSPLDLRSIGHTSQSNGVATNNATEIKKWDQNDVKVPQWVIQNDNRRLSGEDPKLKYEEVIIQQKGKKKLGKRCSNGTDSGISEMVPETESVVKEKKQECSNVWSNMFSRNARSSKSESPKDISEQSDTAKLITTENGTAKHQKILDIPKKIFSNLYSATSDNTPKSHSAAHHVHSKSHRKSKYQCEEDTSSTATESSNNEEADKDSENSPASGKSASSVGKKHMEKTGKKQCPASYRDSYEGDGEDEEYDKQTKPNYQNSNATSNPKYAKAKHVTNNKLVEQKSDSSSERAKIQPEPNKIIYDKLTQCENQNSNNKHNNNHIDTRENKNQTKNNNVKKEKVVLSKKRSLDKSFVFGATKITDTITSRQLNQLTNQQGNNHIENMTNYHSNNINTIDTSLSPNNLVRTSPPTTVSSPSWENKAKFSDVVARSENYLYSTIVAPRKIENDAKSNAMKRNSIPVNDFFNPNTNYKANNDKMRQNLSKSPLGQLGAALYLNNAANVSPLNPNNTSDASSSTWESAYDTTKFVHRPSMVKNLPLASQIQDEIVLAPNRAKSFFHFGNGATKTSQNTNVANKERVQTKHEIGVIGQTKQKPVSQMPSISQLQGLATYRNLSAAPTPITGYGMGSNYGGSSMTLNELYDESVADRMNAVTFGESAVMNSVSSIGSAMGGDAALYGDYSENIMAFNDCTKGWGQTTGGVWDPPSASGSSPVTNTSTSTGEKSAAEWLWGYNGANVQWGANLTPRDTPDPCRAPPPGFESVLPHPPPVTTQNIRDFDPYQSLSAIWASVPAPVLAPAPILAPVFPPAAAVDPWHGGTERPSQ